MVYKHNNKLSFVKGPAYLILCGCLKGSNIRWQQGSAKGRQTNELYQWGIRALCDITKGWYKAFIKGGPRWTFSHVWVTARKRSQTELSRHNIGPLNWMFTRTFKLSHRYWTFFIFGSLRIIVFGTRYKTSKFRSEMVIKFYSFFSFFAAH